MVHWVEAEEQDVEGVLKQENPERIKDFLLKREEYIKEEIQEKKYFLKKSKIKNIDFVKTFIKFNTF